ncbi:unnamed protein product [Bemisia tabaci]|uniref:Uncharacterized protein n=1 Tax=Bemisia tabaci TaxID=7038 RepID=A0A9P0A6R8_BEMTA|nr:unnamed protein product [Bemisia tabaci]
MDTLLNVKTSLCCVRRAKREGHMLANEGAHTAGLIDDAVQGAEFHGWKDETQEQYIMRVQKASDAHYKTTFDTWSAISAELDHIKTLNSSIFINLNRFFREGYEVYLPMKVFAQADRERNRRFATVHSQFDTVFGSFRAAMEKEACPILGFYSAIVRCP